MPFILTLILTCQLSTTPLTAHPITADRSSESGIVQVENLNEFLEPIRDGAGVPALAALVIDGGEVKAIGAVGFRKHGEEVRVTVDDHWHLGSDTKAMTATLAAILVEEGLIRWDSTIGGVLPDLVGKIDEAYHDVTLRQLFMHRGGCPNQTVPSGTTIFALHDLPGDSMIEKRLRYVELFLAGEPQDEPGRRYIYSNGGYTTAGAMLERVTGRPWEELIRERLFAPLDITSAGFGAMGSPDEIDQPRQHVMRNETPFPIEPGPRSDNPLVIGPAGTVHMSLADWAKFVTAHLKGRAGENDLLKQETWELLHERPEEGRYAMGWIVVEREWAQGEALSHAGSNTMNYCTVWASVKRQFAILVATNIGHDLAGGICDQVTGALIVKYTPGG